MVKRHPVTQTRCKLCGGTHAANVSCPRRSRRGKTPARAAIPPAPPAPAPPISSSGRPRTQSTRLRGLLGRVVGDEYGFRTLLGEGGMGAVYVAEHLSIGGEVAIKVLHPNVAQN